MPSPAVPPMHERHLQRILQIASDAIVSVDVDHRIILFNRAAEQLFGYTAQEVLGQPLTMLLPESVADSHDHYMRGFATEPVSWRSMGRQGNPVMAKRRNGSLVHVDASISTVRLEGQTVFTAILRDLTEAEATTARLRNLTYLSTHDLPTHLPNRTMVMEWLASAEASDASQTAVLLIDVAGVRWLTRNYGRMDDEDFVVRMAQRLSSALPSPAMLARFSSSEFAVVLTGLTGPDDAVEVARSVCTAGQDSMRMGVLTVDPRISVGIAVRGSERVGASELLRRADESLRAAQRSNGERIEVFDVSADQLRQDMISALVRAPEDGSLRAYLQPIVEIPTRRIIAFEALVRWVYRGELLEPARFLEIAEEVGAIAGIDRWMLTEACRQQAMVSKRAGTPISVAVNFSARDLANPAEVVTWVRQALAASGIPPERLCVEITETTEIADSEATAWALHEIRELGCDVAVDDFGTGYASLNYLTSLPVNFVKLDGSYTQRASRGEPFAEALIAGLLHTCQQVGISLLAEHVATEHDAERMTAAGVRYGQGYLFAKPRPLEEVLDWMTVTRGYAY